jgi:hypothetical protein
MAHFRFSHPSTPRVRIIQVDPPRKGPSTSAGQGRPHSNKPAGQPGRAGSAAPTPPPHSRSSGHGTHHSVRHTQLHNITTAAPNNTRRGIIRMVISPLSVSREGLLWPGQSRGQAAVGSGDPTHSNPKSKRAGKQSSSSPKQQSSREGNPNTSQQVALQAMLPPEGGSLDSERLLFFQKRSAHSSGDGCQDDPHPNSRSILAFQPECNPRPTPRPRHGQPALIEQQAPLADVMGPTRRSLAPTATICPHPPKKSQSIPKTPV